MSICACEDVAAAVEPDKDVFLGLFIIIQPIGFGVVWENILSLLETLSHAYHFVRGVGGGMNELHFADGDANHEVVYHLIKHFSNIRFISMTMLALEWNDSRGFDGFDT